MMFRAFRRPRLAAAAAALALTALALTGCAGGSASGDGGSATKGDLTWWSWTPDNDLAQREIAAFNKQYPDIKVTYKKIPVGNYAALLRPALASNDGPDVFSLAASGAYSPAQFGSYAVDLTPAITKLLGSDWKSKIQAHGAESFSANGRFVAAPWAKVGAGMLWINKDLFDKYGLTPPKTLADWVTVCSAFRSHGLGCLEEGVNGVGYDVDTIHSIVNSVDPDAWAEAVAGKRKWTDPAFVKAWDIFGTIATNGILNKGAAGIQQYPDVNNDFLSGKVPMVQMGTWYAQYATNDSLTAALAGAGVSADTAKITIVPMDFPDVAGKGNPSTVFADPDAALAVNVKSKSKNAATTFALWLGNTDQGQATVVNNLDSGPNLHGVQPTWDSIQLVNPTVQLPYLKTLVTQLDQATAARNAGVPATVTQALANADQAVVSGQMSGADAAASVQKVADTAK
jgi:raffinose/stachyose/melibiose transport system substrate-binding protein